MRIAMSLLSFRPGRVGGAETYVRQLVTNLPLVASPDDELLLVMDRDVSSGLDASGWHPVVAPIGSTGVVAGRILEAYTPIRARRLERLFRSLRPDVLFFPQQSVFPFHVTSPTVLTVVDIQHVMYPERFGLFDRTFRARAYPRSMARGARIIAISKFTRDTLVERCGMAPDVIAVVPLGFDADTTDDGADRAPIFSGPYLLYPAATYAHKGHEELLRTFAELLRRGDLDAKLVLTGERTRRWGRVLVPLVRSLGIEADVVHLGFVSRDQLHRLYAGASAVVFPSRFEGFGIPVLEAARHGKKIVTSRLPVFNEIGVPLDAQVEFADPGQVLAALRAPAPTRLEKAPITWRECAERTLRVLREAAAG